MTVKVVRYTEMTSDGYQVRIQRSRSDFEGFEGLEQAGGLNTRRNFSGMQV